MTRASVGRLVDALASKVRLSQFASVGFLGYLIDQTIITLLIEVAGAPVWLAKLVSAEAAIAVMFTVNERWTFKRWGRPGLRALVHRFLKSNLVRLLGVLVALGVLLLLTEGFGVHYLIANTIGIGAGFAVNYTAETLFTWRVGR